MGLTKNGVNESTVADLWRELVNAGYDFTADTRQAVHVRYAGKNCEIPGADIRDVALEFDGRTVNGNIEFHVYAGDWRVHGHQHDRAYNNIALHVVMWRQTGEITYRENGQAVPTVAIGQFYDNIRQSGLETAAFNLRPCAQLGEKNPAKVSKVLEQAGEERFWGKGRLFQAELTQHDAAQCLYAGIMEALGYAQNKVPFRKLAGMAPLTQWAHLLTAEDEIPLMTVLCGNAGLLPSQRPEAASHTVDIYTRELESGYCPNAGVTSMEFREWSFFRLRPGNYPARRLAGMVNLLRKYRERGLIDGLGQLVGEAPAENGEEGLLSGVMVKAEGYWQPRFDFGKECRGLSAYLIGESRAAEIIINVVLPFFWAYGQYRGDATLSGKALELFTSFSSREENTVEKHMRGQLGLKRAVAHTACRQQGLLHLYKEFCTQGKCVECLLGAQL
ncbi:MAG: DUF2851 family protein [Dehalococcoidales bacterium]|nr:DUF2851 family protein [Dehalococcoidales bacterium]